MSLQFKILTARAALLGALAVSSAGAVQHSNMRFAAPDQLPRTVLQRTPGRHATAVNGPLLVLDARGGLGQTGPSEAEILAVRQGHIERVLARGLPFPFAEGIAPSPRGRFVAFGEEALGLGVVASDGQHLYRLLRPSRLLNLLGVEPVAWSPDRFTLAYALNIATDVAVNPRQDRALGIWLTPYNSAQPRQLVTAARLGVAGAAGISQLSWSPDGHTLAASTAIAAQGNTAKGPSGSIPAILAVDAKTGKSRLLVKGGQEGVFSPNTGALAYVGDNGTTLRVADARGRHSRVLVSVRGPISSPAWSPDGRDIAYITGDVIIRTVDVATGAMGVTLVASDRTQPLLPPGGQFVRLAWMHATE